jgi:hypothetical protein
VCRFSIKDRGVLASGCCVGRGVMLNLGYIVKAKELAALSAAVLAKIGPIPPPN